MNLKRFGVTVMALVFMVGSGITNINYASELQAQKLTSVEGQIITPYWTNINMVATQRISGYKLMPIGIVLTLLAGC